MVVEVITKEIFHYRTVGHLPKLYTPVPSQDRVSAPPKATVVPSQDNFPALQFISKLESTVTQSPVVAMPGSSKYPVVPMPGSDMSSLAKKSAEVGSTSSVKVKNPKSGEVGKTSSVSTKNPKSAEVGKTSSNRTKNPKSVKSLPVSCGTYHAEVGKTSSKRTKNPKSAKSLPVGGASYHAEVGQTSCQKIKNPKSGEVGKTSGGSLNKNPKSKSAKCTSSWTDIKSSGGHKTSPIKVLAPTPVSNLYEVLTNLAEEPGSKHSLIKAPAVRSNICKILTSYKSLPVGSAALHAEVGQTSCHKKSSSWRFVPTCRGGANLGGYNNKKPQVKVHRVYRFLDCNQAIS